MLDSTSAFSSEQASSQASPCSTSVSVYFIRHAHSAINSPGAPVNVFDPPLSAKGRDQARNIAKAADWLDPGLVLCSPLQRAMETAAIAFENYMDPCTADFVPIIACDSLREVFGGTDRVAEHRRSRSALQQLFPMIDCTELSEEDELLLAFARCNGREHSADLTSRARDFFKHSLHLNLWEGDDAMVHSVCAPHPTRVAVVAHYHIIVALVQALTSSLFACEWDGEPPTADHHSSAVALTSLAEVLSHADLPNAGFLKCIIHPEKRTATFSSTY